MTDLSYMSGTHSSTAEMQKVKMETKRAKPDRPAVISIRKEVKLVSSMFEREEVKTGTTHRLRPSTSIGSLLLLQSMRFQGR